MPVMTAVPRALDIHAIGIGIRAALLANPTIAAAVGTRIYPDDDVSSGPFPYLVYTVVSDLTQGWYSHAGVNDLWQVTAVDRPAGPGYSTTVVSNLGAAIQTALLDTPWIVTGWHLTAVLRENTRPYTENQQGVIFRYVAVTVRIEAYHL